jgi:thiamine pyrophosphokinase
MKVLLIADSPDFDSAYIERHAGKVDSVIVTDGAVEKLPPAVTPHIICGDFDSLRVPPAREKYATSEFITLSDQNQNDLEKALELALKRGATDVTMVSAFGGRMDISLANLSVMIRHHTACKLAMVHGEVMTRVLSDRSPQTASLTFEARPGSFLSCISLNGAAVVSISNAKWPLREAILRPGSHGVSNETIGGPVTVVVHRGLVMVGYEAS